MKRNAIKHMCELYYRKKKNRWQTWFNSVWKCLCRALINIRMFLKCQTTGRLRGQVVNALDLHSLPSPLRDVPGLNTARTSDSRGYSMQSPRRHYHCFFIMFFVFVFCISKFSIFFILFLFFLYIHLISHLLLSIFSAILIPIEAKKM